MRGPKLLPLLLTFCFALTACPATSGLYDFDGDGSPDTEDCAPEDPLVRPGVDDPEGDGIDQNCDGVDGVLDCDIDNDGYEGLQCAGPDCNDESVTVFPGAEEGCDGVDSDCDGELPAEEQDSDGDGDPFCADCDDTDPEVGGLDVDQDGYTACTGDCAEGNSSIHPAANDDWGDGVDQNCDGVDGEDADGDGYPGNAPAGDGNRDCDDDDPLAWPGSGGWSALAPNDDPDCDGEPGTQILNAAWLVLSGETPNGRAGYAIAATGDLDGDGLGDVVVGAPWNDGGGAERGRVYILLGADLVALAPGEATLAEAAHATIEGAVDYARIGMSIAAGGDVDGDGLPDVLLGSTSDDTSGENAGRVYVVLGSDLLPGGQTSVSGAYASLLGEAPGDEAGFSVAWAGDVDADGLDDILVGAPQNEYGSDGAGRAYLVLGHQLVGGGDFSLSSACT